MSSGTAADASNPEAFEPTIDVKPIVELPDVETDSGEGNEEELWKAYAPSCPLCRWWFGFANFMLEIEYLSLINIQTVGGRSSTGGLVMSGRSVVLVMSSSLRTRTLAGSASLCVVRRF
jgi:hypothetical protein